MAFNPELGSTSPAVLLDNAERLDKLVNGPAAAVPDRGGDSLKSWRLQQQEIANTLVNFQENGGAMGFSSLQELLAFIPDKANVLAVDTSTGEQYLWNGTEWVPSEYQVNSQIKSLNEIVEKSHSTKFFQRWKDRIGTIIAGWKNDDVGGVYFLSRLLKFGPNGFFGAGMQLSENEISNKTIAFKKGLDGKTRIFDKRGVMLSLMYFEARHVSKTIQKVRSPVLDMGNLVHALALQPDQLEKEFSIEPEIPEGAFTTTATIRAFIDEYNNGLPVLLSADDIKRFLEEYNANLPAQVPLGTSVEETGQGYMSLPAEFQRIEDGQKQTATAMKACIKEYNATLPAQVKTSGGRDVLLEQLALINPDMVAQEAQKAQPLKVSGTKADLIQAVKSVQPDAVFADELLDAWRENPEGKVLVTRQQLATALAIQKALLNHPTAGKLLTHPSRAVEVSYFGIDEETGLEVRVRPDLEIDMGGLRIGADLKTISMWNIKQEGLRAKLHREIIERDYHLSAAMYCETAALDQFFWIFVNKDENYHWIAIIEASEELLELGMLEYRKAMRAIANGFDTGEWPAPITEDYTEELNDFDVRRLEALRVQA